MRYGWCVIISMMMFVSLTFKTSQLDILKNTLQSLSWYFEIRCRGWCGESWHNGNTDIKSLSNLTCAFVTEPVWYLTAALEIQSSHSKWYTVKHSQTPDLFALKDSAIGPN